MEENRPDVDYASGKDDPSKSDSPPASGSPSTAGELTQAEGERSQVSYCVLSGRMASIWSRTVCRISLTPDIVLTPSTPGLSRAGEVTQPPSQSPQPKRKSVSSATSGERHIKVCHCLIPGQCHCMGVVILMYDL